MRFGNSFFATTLLKSQAVGWLFIWTGLYDRKMDMDGIGTFFEDWIGMTSWCRWQWDGDYDNKTDSISSTRSMVEHLWRLLLFWSCLAGIKETPSRQEEGRHTIGKWHYLPLEKEVANNKRKQKLIHAYGLFNYSRVHFWEDHRAARVLGNHCGYL